MMKIRNIAITFGLLVVLVWMSGCAGCNPPPEPSGIDVTSGPETGGTKFKISGAKFDVKNGVTVTFGGKATNARAASDTEITGETPSGRADDSVKIVVQNNNNEQSVTLTETFTYTDATPPKVTTTSPQDNDEISDYDDSMNVMSEISISFSENVLSESASVHVQQDDGSEITGAITGTGDTITFTSDNPLTAGHSLAVTVTSVTDEAGNPLASPHKFSFSIAAPQEKVKYYRVQEGDTLESIAARPEVYGDGSKSYQLRLIEGNQDYSNFDPRNLPVGLQLIVPRGRAWGDTE